MFLLSSMQLLRLWCIFAHFYSVAPVFLMFLLSSMQLLRLWCILAHFYAVARVF